MIPANHILPKKEQLSELYNLNFEKGFYLIAYSFYESDRIKYTVYF